MTSTNEHLITENEELKLRLAETEEALAAIRSGEVDAIMVPGRGGEQVYSISSAETPYRTFVEEMNEGAVTLSAEGLIIYCNQKFAALVDEPIERVIGSYFQRFVNPDNIPGFNKLLKRRGQKVRNALTVSLVNSLFLKLSLHLLPSYLQGENCILVATDITEIMQKKKKLLEFSELLEQKLGVIQQLRMRLIEKKIDSDVEIRKLKSANKKLAEKIDWHKQAQKELKLKLKKKKRTI
jgi:two-component system CheB/CheR fusion protein